MVILKDKIMVNTHDRSALPNALRLGFGLEIEEYIRPLPAENISEKQAIVASLMNGFSNFTFHGIVIDYNEITALTENDLYGKYIESLDRALFHNINSIVFHANFVTGSETASAWITRQSSFWKRFLRDTPGAAHIYLENFVDETPDIMAQLCDEVNDSRFKICFDTGHAACNSTNIDVGDWVKQLGRRIEHVHLHNNDGVSDRHWPLGKGVLNMKSVIDGL